MRLIMADQDWTRQREKRFWRDHLRHVGFNVLEPGQLWSKPPAEIRRLLAFEGEEHLARALDQGSGVILFINHAGSSSCVPLLARFDYDITVAGDAMLVPHLERKLQFIFNAIGAKRVLLGDRVPQRAAEVFRRNGIFAAYTDLSTTPRHTEWAPFGPAEIRVPLGPAVLALRHKAPVLYANSIRISEHEYRLQISPPLVRPEEGELSTRAHALVDQANRHLLQAVRAHPEQWWALDYVRVRAPVVAAPCS
jgi:lauroyl/myristoyl acyltransferase